MPFPSEKQRRYMHANLPDSAKRWERDYAGGGFIPAHEAGIYGLAEGGQLVKPGPGRPGYQGWDPGAGAPQATETQSSSTSGGNGGYQTVHDTGAITQTPGRITTTPVDRDDGPQRNVHFDTPEILEEQKKLDLQQMVRDQSEKTETWEKAQQWNKPNKFVSFIKNAALAIIPGLLPAKLATGWKVGKLALDYKAGKLDRFIPDQFSDFKSDGKFAMEIANTVTENAEKRKTEKAEQDLINSLPRGHPERIQLEKLKKETPDDVPDRDGVTQDTSITIDAEEVNDAKTQLLIKYQEMNDASRLAWLRQQQMNRDKQMAYYRMMMKPYFTGAAQGGRVPAGYNTGGLSNLFRLKNV